MSFQLVMKETKTNRMFYLVGLLIIRKPVVMWIYVSSRKLDTLY